MFLELLDDLDTLLQTDAHFLMGRWIADARALGMYQRRSKSAILIMFAFGFELFEPMVLT